MGYRLNQTSLDGETYVRCHQVVIDNRMAAVPRVTFHQERVMSDGAAVIGRAPMGPCALTYDPAAEITVIDPQTGEPTGETVTHEALMVLVYSAYLAAANPPLEEEPTP